MKTMRFFCVCLMALAATTAFQPVFSQGTPSAVKQGNLVVVAMPSGSMRSGTVLASLNDGLTPANDGGMQRNGNRQPPRSMLWLQYEWTQPVGTKEIAVYWWDYNSSLRPPEACRVQYWNRTDFVPVKNASGQALFPAYGSTTNNTQRTTCRQTSVTDVT